VQVRRLLDAARDPEALDRMPIHRFVDWFAV